MVGDDPPAETGQFVPELPPERAGRRGRIVPEYADVADFGTEEERLVATDCLLFPELVEVESS